MKPDNPYDERYAGEGFYWGKKPSSLCDRVIELVGRQQRGRLKLIDLGCGEGRNAVAFARYGFDVVGLDVSEPGLEKTRRHAAEAGVDVRTVHADVLTCELDETYDVVFSTGTLHYLPREIREERFAHFKRATAPNGLHAVTVFVETNRRRILSGRASFSDTTGTGRLSTARKRSLTVVRAACRISTRATA